MEQIVIRKITADEVPSAMALALEVFMQFEAPAYSPEPGAGDQRHPVYPHEVHHKASELTAADPFGCR